MVRACVKENYWTQWANKFVDNFTTHASRNHRNIPPETEVKLIARFAEQITTTTSQGQATMLKILNAAIASMSAIGSRVIEFCRSDAYKTDVYLTQVEKLVLLILKKDGCADILANMSEEQAENILNTLFILMRPTGMDPTDPEYLRIEKAVRRQKCADILRLLLGAAPSNFLLRVCSSRILHD